LRFPPPSLRVAAEVEDCEEWKTRNFSDWRINASFFFFFFFAVDGVQQEEGPFHAEEFLPLVSEPLLLPSVLSAHRFRLLFGPNEGRLPSNATWSPPPRLRWSAARWVFFLFVLR